MTHQPSLRVVFEGLPGAGKTTVAERLARELDLPLVPEWVFPEATLRRFAGSVPFFLFNDLLKEQCARHFQGHTVLMDRHHHGALAFLTASGGPGAERYVDLLRAGALEPAELLVVLDVPAAVSIARQPRAARAEARFGDLASLEIMRAYYLTIPGCEVVPATGPLDGVLDRCRELVTRRRSRPVARQQGVEHRDRRGDE